MTSPHPLDYSPPTRQPRRPLAWGSFLLGIVAGLGFSALYYFGMAKMGLFDRFIWSALGAVVIKVVVASVLMQTRWRSFAVGVFTSIPLAVLIFVGVCFAALSSI